MTNAFNLLDNMDGLCAGIAHDRRRRRCSSTCCLARQARGRSAEAQLPRAPARRHRRLPRLQRPPGVDLHGRQRQPAARLQLRRRHARAPSTRAPGRSDVLSIVAAPVLVLLIPIFDTTLVTVSRLLSGRRASQGGRDHSSHRLVAIGLSERRAVAVLWLLAAVGGALGIALDYVSQSWSALAAVVVPASAMVLFAAYLAGIRVYDDERRPGEAGRAHADRRRVHVQAARRRGAARLLPGGALLLRRVPAALRGSRRLHEELRRCSRGRCRSCWRRRWSRSSPSASIAASGATSA